jgi:hypothetical protein
LTSSARHCLQIFTGVSQNGPTDGPLAEVDETRPTLARQAVALRSDHDYFLLELLALRDEVQQVGGLFSNAAGPPSTAGAGRVADPAAIRQQAEKLLTGLQQIKRSETGLVLESLNTDIGVGD